MRLSSHIKTAIHNLSASKLRTFLAMLGILVGTISVVVLVSGGQLATQQALNQFKGMGTDLMRVNFSRINPNDNNSNIDLSLLMNMQEKIPDILMISPIISTSLPAAFRDQSFSYINILAAEESLDTILHIKMKAGRFLNDLDADQYFCVLGSNIAKQLYSLSLLNEQIRLGDTIFTIIGIADIWPENNIVDQNINDSVMISLSSIKQITTSASINTVLLKLNANADIDTVKQDITHYFNKNFVGYKTSFQSAKEMIARIKNQQVILTFLLGLIGSIALFVGGIGIMNIMLASVAERHHEIGIRIAIGAQPKDVQLMFLTEAAVLSILGGGLGVILGIATTFVIAQIANWDFEFFILPPLIGFSVSFLVSIFFGFYPAYLASKLDAIEILRS